TKKLTTRTIGSFRREQKETISFSCELFGVDRQVYYRHLKRRAKRQQNAQQVVDWVEELRMIHPKMGGKKLYFLLKEKLENLKIGRDKFFDILRANHLLIIPKRSYHKTTNSYHRFKKHKNLIKIINTKNQIMYGYQILLTWETEKILPI